MIHSVLVLITVTTGLLWINAATGNSLLNNGSGLYNKTYGFFIGAVFSAWFASPPSPRPLGHICQLLHPRLNPGNSDAGR